MGQRKKRVRDRLMGQLSRPKSDMKEDKLMGKLSRGERGPGDLWGKGTLVGRERGLAKSKSLMGPLVRRGENLWGKP